MRCIAKIVIVSVIAIALISVILTVFIPTHIGEIRQDLRVGDYYVMAQNDLVGATTFLTEYRITGFTEDGLLVITIKAYGEKEEVTESKEEFLNLILLPRNDMGYEIKGYATLETGFGSRFCAIYQCENTEYWVGEHDIIYRQSSHGYNTVLKETSLIIR